MKRAWLIGLLVAATPSSHAAICHLPSPISDGDAANAIVGEAAACPYLVKLGIAEALHNRCNDGRWRSHPLRGVYGFHAKHNLTEPPWVWCDARRAWAQSSIENRKSQIVKGAIFFGNADDVAKGTFAGLTWTVTLGAGRNATYFFKA